jgi:hypothetical protein
MPGGGAHPGPRREREPANPVEIGVELAVSHDRAAGHEYPVDV